MVMKSAANEANVSYSKDNPFLPGIETVST